MLQDCEQFSACHDKYTAKHYYLSEDLKKAMAIRVQQYYREQLNKSEEVVQIENGIYISDDQDLRFKDELKELSDAKLKHWCTKVDRKDQLTGRTLARIIYGRELAALLRIIATSEEDNWGISKADSLLDIFLKGSTVRTKYHKWIIKRLLHLCPDSNNDARILKENIIEYAELLAASDDDVNYSPKEVLATWTDKILSALHRLRSGAIENPNILLIFADLTVKYGDKRYCLRNDSLELSMDSWVELSQRHGRLTPGEDNRMKPRDYLEHLSIKVANSREETKLKSTSSSLECNSPSLEGHDQAQESYEGHDQGQECYPSLPSPRIECSVDTDDENNVLSIKGFSKEVEIKIFTPSKIRGIDFDDEMKKKMLVDLIKYSDAFLDIMPRTPVRQIADICEDIRNREVLYKGESKLWKQLATPKSMAQKLSRKGFAFQMKGGSGDKSTGLLSFLRDLIGKDDISGARDRLEEIESIMDKKLDKK